MLRSNNIGSSIIQNQAPMGTKYTKCHCYWTDLSRSKLFTFNTLVVLNLYMSTSISGLCNVNIIEGTSVFSYYYVTIILFLPLVESPTWSVHRKNWHEDEEEGNPRAFEVLFHHMKSFVINKSVVYALYMSVCASKHAQTHAHTHTHTGKNTLNARTLFLNHHQVKTMSHLRAGGPQRS